ncbi:toxin VasX [Psychrobacter sp. Pi2-51]|uniref:toxin VasX n=1 Tax=Psychrobacter sp. Pi2-51 TaxID=2774132 RepID=UPI00191AA7A2|nr:toxin VasX [Psychrobacter sp. Pi2-51]
MSESIDKYIDNLRGNDDQHTSEVLDDITNDHKIKLAVNSEGGSKIDSIFGPFQCPYECGKRGIPILPVVFSQKSYNLSAKDERYFNHLLAEKSQSNTALASLPTQIYLYVYFKYLSGIEYISEYYTGNDGSFKEITKYDKEKLEGDSKEASSSKRKSIIDESISQPINCTEPQHSTIATKYICLSQEYDVAFLKVSHARLSVTVLKKYMQDENFRKKGMQKFVMADQVKNINTIFMSNNEKEYINSFNRRKELEKGNDIDSKIIVSEQSSYASKKNTLSASKTSVSQDYIRDSYMLAKSSQQAAKLLYERMHYSIKDSIEDIRKADYILASNPKDISTLVNAKPMMVALPDPVGEVLAAAEKCNYLISQLSQLSENSNLRKVANALIIKNLEESSIKTTKYNDKEWFNWGDNDYLGTFLNDIFSDTDPDTLIFKHIKEDSYRFYLRTSQQVIGLKKQLFEARKNYISIITDKKASLNFQYVLENDFDINLSHDEETAKGFEAIVAGCITNCGIDDSNLGLPQSILDAFAKSAPKSNDIADEEFQKILLPQFKQSTEINKNWLLKALGGLDKNLVQKLYDFSKQDRGTEAAGAGIGYLSEQISAGELESIKVDSERSAAANKNALVKTLSQNLIKLYHHDVKAFKNLHLTLQASIYGHTGIKIVPRRVIASMDTMSAFANYAMDMTVPKTLKDAINARARKIKSGAINKYEGMSGNTVTRLPNIDTPAQAQIYILNHIDEAKRSNKGVSSLEPLNNGKPINLDALDAEQLAAEARQWRGKSANVAAGGFSIFITFFQLKSVVAILPFLSKLRYAGDKLLLTQTQLGTASTSLAIVTASMDTTAAGASIIGRTSFASKLIYRAGWIGVVGAVLEIGSLTIYGYRKFNDGNRISVIYTGLAIGSISASAVAGLIYGYAAVSTSSAGTAAIPGAVLLSIMMIGLSLSYSFQRLAYKYDDKQNVLIEYWLDNSVFGNQAMRGQDYYLINPFQTQPVFNSLAEDISGFITACSGFFAKSTLSKNHGRTNGILGGAVAGIHGIKFNSQVVMGQFIDSSELHISVELVTKDGKVLNNIFNMSMSSTNGSLGYAGFGGNFDSSQVVIESKDKNTVVTIKDIYIKNSVYSADSIQKGRVIIKYIADATQNPVYPLYDFAYMDNNKY